MQYSRYPSALFGVVLLCSSSLAIAASPIVSDQTRLGTLPGNVVNAYALPAGRKAPISTNRWWTYNPMDAWPTPLHAWPLVVNLQADGVLVRAPVPLVAGKAIMSDHRDIIRLFPRDRNGVRADPIGSGDWDVSFRTTDAVGAKLYDATLVQGSPFAWFEVQNREWGIAIPAGTTTKIIACPAACGSALLITAPKTTYLITSSQANSFVVQGSDVRMNFTGSATFSVAVVAPSADPQVYLPYALKIVRGTKATYAVENSRVVTTYSYPFETLVGILPHQYTQLTLAPPNVGVYSTTHGHILLARAKSFATALPRPTVMPGVPGNDTLANDAALIGQLRADVQENLPLSGDIYGAAKDMLRKANVAEVAEAMGDTALRDQALSQVREHLTDYCTASSGNDPRYFAYDSRAGGMIALPVAFGSEHYNDHHFHYGYVIRTAAILGRFDAQFTAQYGQCIRLLIRDIANTDPRDGLFPRLRHFDVFTGHSWAGGMTSFGDGNNQESTSEAMQAWYGIAMFGRVTGDKSLEDLGTWLLAQEKQSTRTYWLNANPAAKTLPKSFGYPMISILWGGKSDYATFFDGSDGAIRGIQFFPVSPALFGVVDRDVASRIISPTAATADAGGIWKSALQMALSISPVSEPTVAAGTKIDFVYSRSFVNFWQKALASIGEPTGSLGSCAGSVFTKNGVQTAYIYRYAKDPAQCTATISGRVRTFGPLQPGWNLQRM